MDIAEIITELKQASPNTAAEFLVAGILLLLGIVVVFDPDSIAFIGGINPDPALQNINGVQAIALLFSSVVPILATGFVRSLRSGE